MCKLSLYYYYTQPLPSKNKNTNYIFYISTSFSCLSSSSIYATLGYNIITTGNYLIKQFLCRLFLFQLWKIAHNNLISDLMLLKWRIWKCIFKMWWCRSLRIWKIFKKQLREFVVFIDKGSLLITKSETGFQNFILTIHHWAMNLDQDAHPTLIEML